MFIFELFKTTPDYDKIFKNLDEETVENYILFFGELNNGNIKKAKKYLSKFKDKKDYIFLSKIVEILENNLSDEEIEEFYKEYSYLDENKIFLSILIDLVLSITKFKLGKKFLEEYLYYYSNDFDYLLKYTFLLLYFNDNKYEIYLEKIFQLYQTEKNNLENVEEKRELLIELIQCRFILYKYVFGLPVLYDLYKSYFWYGILILFIISVYMESDFLLHVIVIIIISIHFWGYLSIFVDMFAKFFLINDDFLKKILTEKEKKKIKYFLYIFILNIIFGFFYLLKHSFNKDSILSFVVSIILLSLLFVVPKISKYTFFQVLLYILFGFIYIGFFINILVS